MPYDEGLAERIRTVLADHQGVVEKKMFGGIAFMIRGHMSVGIVKDALMVRVGTEQHEKLLRRPHARPMDFTGRPMKGFLFVDSSGLESDTDLEEWIAHGVDYAASIPSQGERQRRMPSRTRAPRRKK
jgi:TfoX/Sxy family transcriptional regulator of competence genes